MRIFLSHLYIRSASNVQQKAKKSARICLIRRKWRHYTQLLYSLLLLHARTRNQRSLRGATQRAAIASEGGARLYIQQLVTSKPIAVKSWLERSNRKKHHLNETIILSFPRLIRWAAKVCYRSQYVLTSKTRNKRLWFDRRRDSMIFTNSKYAIIIELRKSAE